MSYATSDIDVFVVCPRTGDSKEYWLGIQNAIKWGEKYGYTGVLLFTGNDTYVDPWIAAHWAFLSTSRSCPLVAVNPIYMHPFTVAKMTSTFAYLYQRRTYLNLVTGTAVSHLGALDDHLSHAERYDRLAEYAQVVNELTSSTKPTNFDGRYYKTRNLHLLPRIPADLQPRFVFAGNSDDASRAARSVGGLQMRMLAPTLCDEIASSSFAIHFGVITRKEEADAWAAARKIFPPDEIGRKELELSMLNTDSVWKIRMKRLADLEGSRYPEYWLEPFRMFKADCPYYIGSYESVARLFDSLIQRGAKLFVIDLPSKEGEFLHLGIALGKTLHSFRAITGAAQTA